MNVLSVCSGAGGMDLGFHRAGNRTIGLCEWDPWRRDLLAARFPGVPIHDDLARLAGECEADPDAVIRWLGGTRPRLLIGGTPCQDLSVAGKRAGLDGSRSGLYFAYQRVRIALGIEWAVWENVAGALSSNDGLDFAQVVGAFVGADVPVPAAGWGGAGVAAGPWGGCVWRLLDAQHFGVPQRRRRVFVVGHLGGPCPPEVLLEPARSSGDSAPRRGSRPGAPRVAATLTRGTSSTGVSAPGRRQEDDINLVAGTVRSHPRPGSNDWGGIVNALDTQGGGPDDNSAQAGHLVAYGLPHDAGPDQRRGDAGDGSEVGRERRTDGLAGAEADADGVRAADGLARWLDDPNPLPDGRRYAACGDGVVAHVAEWIGRRIPERGSLI